MLPPSSRTCPFTFASWGRTWWHSAIGQAKWGSWSSTAPIEALLSSTARSREQGIRCCYHGWLYGTNGLILETPGESADSTLKDRLCHGAYPVREHGGLVFAYMGPIDKQPAFPLYDTFDVPGTRFAVLPTIEFPCNWLQVKENSMDPAHLYFLHTTISEVQFKDDLAIKSEMDFMETPRGMVYIDTRRMGDNAWVRMSDYIPPYIHQFLLNPPGERVPVGHGERTHWSVPSDDTHTKVIGLIRLNEGEEAPTDAGFGQTADRSYEERQRVPGDYDAQVTQRPIARHALEHLAVTDRGVIMLRNIVRRGIRAVQNGEEPDTLHVKEGQTVPTYSCSQVFPLPPAPTFEEDRVLLREAGRRAAEESVRTRTANGGGSGG